MYKLKEKNTFTDRVNVTIIEVLDSNIAPQTIYKYAASYCFFSFSSEKLLNGMFAKTL